MTAIKTIVRALTESQINFDREVIALHKIESGVNWDISEEWTQVMSVYTDGKGGSIHYRLDGIKNNYFRKAETCNDLTYSKSDRVYAKLGDIHYDIPTGGVPVIKDKHLAEVWAESPVELDIRSFVLENAAGEFVQTYGDPISTRGDYNEDSTYYVSEMGLSFVNLTNRAHGTVLWVRFSHHDTYYIVKISDIEQQLYLSALKATRNRLAIRLSIDSTRSYPRLVQRTDILQKNPNLQEIMDNAILVESVEFYVTPIMNIRMPREVTNPRRGTVAREIIDLVVDETDIAHVFLRESDDCEDSICVKINKTKVGDLNHVLHLLGSIDRILKRFYIVYTDWSTLPEPEPLLMPSIPSERESVVWKATAVNEPSTPYVVSVVLTSDDDEKILTRCRDVARMIPGLHWCEAIEMYGDGRVLVHEHGILKGTPAAVEKLRQQIATTPSIIGVRVGIVSMSVNRNYFNQSYRWAE